MKLLPGFGGTRMVVDAGFSSGALDWPAFGAGLVWLIGLGIAVFARFAAKARGS